MFPGVGTTSCRGIAGTAALGGGFVSDGVGHVVPLGNFGPGRETAPGRRAAVGEHVVKGVQWYVWCAWGSERVCASLPAAAQRVSCSREERTASVLQRALGDLVLLPTFTATFPSLKSRRQAPLLFLGETLGELSFYFFISLIFFFSFRGS